MYKKLIFIAIVLFTINACTKETFDPGATMAVKGANEWWVNYYVDGEELAANTKLLTYNTSANNDSMWIDDLKNFYGLKAKAKLDSKALTFVTTDSYEEYFKITATITEGKIMKNVAHTTTGVVTDSIYFKVVFSDDPATTYEVKGSGRSMWSEDDF